MKTSWMWIQQGGILMYPILLCSVISVAVFLEKLFTLRVNRIIPHKFREDILKAESVQNAREIIKQRKHIPTARILSSSLDALKIGWQEAISIMNDAGEREFTVLSRGLKVLSTIGTVAPMLGFLGTVFGMIEAFSSIAKAGVGKPETVASGISKALITTAAGLIVGIMSIIAYNFLNGRIQKIAYEVEDFCYEVMIRLYKDEVSKDKRDR